MTSICVLHWCISLASPENTLHEDFRKITGHLGMAFLQEGSEWWMWAAMPCSRSVHPVRSSQQGFFHKQVRAMASTLLERRQLAQDHGEPVEIVPSSWQQGEKESQPAMPGPMFWVLCTSTSSSTQSCTSHIFLWWESTRNTAVLLSPPADTLLHAMVIFSDRQSAFIRFRSSNPGVGFLLGRTHRGSSQCCAEAMAALPGSWWCGFTAAALALRPRASSWASPDQQHPFCWRCRLQAWPSLLALYRGYKLLEKY